MKTRAAVMIEPGKPFEIEELDLDEPGPFEVRIRYEYSGLCHSDLHLSSGEIACRMPMVAGHEGAGVIEAVGASVSRVAVGDHVVCSFIACCGTCRWCATGQQAICDWGATMLEGYLPGPHWVLSGPRGQYGAGCLLGTMSQYGVLHENSVVAVPMDVPLDKAALVGCGVPTGWGSAVYAADVRPGETVVVYGIGGIGSNAVQGAAYAGARNVVAVDPVAFKRESAETMGATHTVADGEAAERLVQQLTGGVGADKAIVTVGKVEESVVSSGFGTIRKGGTIVITGMGPLEANSIQLPGTILALYKKTVRGTLFGDCNPTYDIPRILDLYQAGLLKLDELITRTYTLNEINQGYEDLEAGKNIRGVIKQEH
ncbi:MAG: Zn-dependent alcohol dehydrogenase [Pseudonocardia sp.]|uniref:Zn-dependent alcohol dehydrogenase n=1 Tax=unclassified Pseudonocardia TaxID=2619320 RepID=UPI00086F4A47|nr:MULTISPECIES: Zn-dependent alcohol dehydrogenase [unclassified Pseudonocardia]MBN9109359.1 Zn-dependent alcohol dehydrogenase [Pseudonocardia sp.]ODU29503.1 MAG: alcohol dehydrogenase [Pseudonocardia sp. SCN 72-51]ODV08071.1 MAG: alcohol dehydrogenase [Pseudonocardia sp. SCN 73-27]